MLKLKTKECKKINANAVGADDPVRPLFREHTKNTPAENSNLNSKIQTPNSTPKGITLIALIITIIVMLILVAVTVNVALNGGLFNKAKQATTKTQEAIEEEQKLAEGKVQVDGKWYNSMQDYLDGKESIIGNWKLSTEGNTVTDGKVTLNIGDYVNYKPDEDTYSSDKLTEDYTGNTNSSYNNSDLATESLKWRVLGVDANGCLTLISEKPTTEEVCFKGAKGYNNGVYILNDICEKLYSNKELGVTARSITIEDIEAGFSEDGKTARDNYNKDNSSGTQYGNTKTYTSNLNYPVIYAEENGSGIGVEEKDVETGIKKDGIGGSDPFYKTEDQLNTSPDNKGISKAIDALTCKQTYYCLESNPNDDYCMNEEFCDMIFGINASYWLASRCVDCAYMCVGFKLHGVENDSIFKSDLYDSDGISQGGYAEEGYLRPLVALGSNITVIKSEVEANGSDVAHMHSLSRTE